MVRTKGTTSKALQLHFKIKQEEQGTIINNNGGAAGESSFRLLYYGDASAGSVPFMWESHPGTPKHSTTQSSLPPLTPPPAFHQFSQNPTSLRTLFLDASFRKSHVEAAPPSSTSYSSISYDSSQLSRTSLRSLFLASSSRKARMEASPSPVYSSLPCTPMHIGQGKTEFRRRRAGVKLGMEEKHVGGGGGGDGSPTSTLCFGGGLMRVCRIKKVKNALMSIGGPW